MKKHLIIATRESPLALWQANWVKERLQEEHPELKIKLLGITTQADASLAMTLMTIGGKGLFVKELEQALLDGHADIAVHSMKDVPMELPVGLCIPVYCEREEARDAFISNHYSSLNDLPSKAVVGTSSLRRQSQIKALRPDLIISNLRGNVNTRIARLDHGDFAAIILAAAGLTRLGLSNKIKQCLTIQECLPAAGQGVIGIECREADLDVRHLIATLNHPETEACVLAERMVCRNLGGGCRTPIGAYAEIKSGKLVLTGLVARPDGSLVLKSQVEGLIENSDQLSRQVAEDLIIQGADEILQSLL